LLICELQDVTKNSLQRAG